MPLIDTDPDSQIDAMRERLSDADAGVRRVALLDFADVESVDLLPAIVAVLRDDPDPDLRAEAARALAGWGHGDVVEALADALGDEPVVRNAAAQSLSELKDATAAACLVRHAGSTDRFTCCAALRALRELRVPAAALPATHALDHPDAGVRREAVGVLGWLRHAPALSRLAAIANGDLDPEVRRAATGALGFASLAELPLVLGALCERLEDSAWQVREEAATTLGKVTDLAAPGSDMRSAAGTALRRAMEDDYWQVRLRAARSLGRLRDLLALDVLVETLVHQVGNLRKEAAIALGEIGDARAARALQAAAADPDPEVRKAVRIALERLS